MPFVDFLRATVLLSAASATLLAVITVVEATNRLDGTLVYVAAGWWIASVLIGAVLGRHSQTSPPIARLLASAKSQRALPEQAPGRMLLNRLWPLLLATLLAAGAGIVIPQVAAVAAGFGIIWALAWRRQESAVAAIEERDGVRFYVDRTGPLAPMRLIRTPGFRGSMAPKPT